MQATTLLLVSLVVTAVILSVLFFAAWHALGRSRHAFLWGVAYLFATAQWLCNLNRHWFASHDIYWTVVSALVLAFLYLVAWGHLSRVDRTDQLVWVTRTSLAVFIAIVAVTFVIPHFGLKIGMQPVFAGVLLLFCAYRLHRYRRHALIDNMAATMTAIAGIAQIAAGSAAIAQGWERHDYWLSLYQQLNFTVIPAAHISTSMLMILVMAGDMAARMYALAISDPLTGLKNRRGFFEAADPLLTLARRQHAPLAALILDIDRFKTINDRYGHAVGDLAIQHFATILSEQRRNEDVLARIGGEEFAVLLPGSDRQAAVKIASGIRHRLHAFPLQVDTQTLALTASIGVAELKPGSEEDNLQALLHRADQAQYRAKQNGRDRVVTEQALQFQPTTP